MSLDSDFLNHLAEITKNTDGRKLSPEESAELNNKIMFLAEQVCVPTQIIEFIIIGTSNVVNGVSLNDVCIAGKANIYGTYTDTTIEAVYKSINKLTTISVDILELYSIYTYRTSSDGKKMEYLNPHNIFDLLIMPNNLVFVHPDIVEIMPAQHNETYVANIPIVKKWIDSL